MTKGFKVIILREASHKGLGGMQFLWRLQTSPETMKLILTIKHCYFEAVL